MYTRLCTRISKSAAHNAELIWNSLHNVNILAKKENITSQTVSEKTNHCCLHAPRQRAVRVHWQIDKFACCSWKVLAMNE